MLAYRVEIQDAADRDLDRLAPTLFRRLMDHITALGTEPRQPGAIKLSGVAAYRIRVGDHRVIYMIDDSARVVRVTRVAHRSEVYRRLR